VSVSGTVDGRDVGSDGSKLDGIESGATGDQTASEIKSAYESNADTNAFTDAEQSKLSGIEDGATADQTKGDIDALGIDAETLDGLNSSQFLRSDTSDTMSGDLSITGTVDGRDISADGSKLDNIEANADVTDTTNVTAAGALMDSELTDETAVKAIDQGLATTDSVEFTGMDLAAIAESKSESAVDVFIYDTSRDSDGGAWRKRTQHTSWYNEPLNTSTRGSRREFPAVAVIVAENNKVTIYDGDDPDLPMWIVVPQGSNHWFRNGRDVTSVTMLNGKLSFGTSETANTGLHTADFLSDVLIRYEPNMAGGPDGGIAPFSLSDRGIDGNPSNFPLAGAEILSEDVNDVAMTILPDAPIDAATGLPVPTIAVATNGGVSVIKDDGTVVDSADTVTQLSVSIDQKGVWYGRDGSLFFATTEDYQSGDGFGNSVGQTSAGAADFDMLTSAREVIVEDELLYLGSTLSNNQGVQSLAIHQPNYPDFTKGMSALLTSTYNTGWMNGDIKGAFLSDTDDTDLVGSGELVTNGTFDTDTSGWTGNGTSILTIDNGAIKVDRNGGSFTDQAFQDITTEVGKRYKLSVEIVSIPTAFATARVVGASGQLADIGTYNAPGVYHVEFVADSTTTRIDLRPTLSITGVSVFDNVSVKLADEDRSVNNNGLVINGTITRTFVDEV